MEKNDSMNESMKQYVKSGHTCIPGMKFRDRMLAFYPFHSGYVNPSNSQKINT